MARFTFVILVALGVVSVARAELVKPIDLNKQSSFSGKEYGTKSTPTKDFNTKQYRHQEEYRSKTYSTKDFSYSSKNFDTHESRDSMKEFSVGEVPAEQAHGTQKEFTTKSYESDKKITTPATPHQIADKPVTDWRTLIRKEPPKGLPGKHQDLPFSRWRLESVEPNAK